MLFISHRGNLTGPNPETENTVSAIMDALLQGCHVEVDVYLKDTKLYLGHDGPEREIDFYFLQDPRIICHAKTPQTFLHFLHSPKGMYSYFYHENDTITTLFRKTETVMWSANDTLTDREKFYTVYVNKGPIEEKPFLWYGICSDYILPYKNWRYGPRS